MAKITLIINGQKTVVDQDPDMPLLWFLRDSLHLTGTKYSCGKGICGTCTVHVDGEPTKSCITSLSEVNGSRITTIEGLSKDNAHPLQQAWQEQEVSQCGYCQPGQIMTAAALLAKDPNPSDKTIDETMSSVLCRCGTYQRIRSAIHLAASGGGK